MNQSKNIIITSCLLTMFGDSSQVFGSSGGVVSHPVQPNPSPLYALACNASYLPEGLREKFKMGGYSIDEIADHLVIEVLDMNSQRLEPLVNAIKQESVPAFFERSTIGHPDMTIVFLQVGDGKYFYPDLFEKLIVVRDGTCITVQHGYRDIWGEFGLTRTASQGASDHNRRDYGGKCISDDRNILEALRSIDWYQDLSRGKIQVFIYHKRCNTLFTFRARPNSNQFLQENVYREPEREEKSCLGISSSMAAKLYTDISRRFADDPPPPHF